MSDTIPTFNSGDLVRIMQTRDMEHAGLANKIGVVAAVLTHRYDALCLIDLRSGEQVKVMASSLQRITAEDEARWAANASKAQAKAGAK